MNKKNEKRNTKEQVKVAVGAREYAALAEIAEAMNRVGWCGDDNTAESVLAEFALCLDLTSVKEAIVNGICTETEDADLDFERREGLKLALAGIV